MSGKDGTQVPTTNPTGPYEVEDDFDFDAVVAKHQEQFQEEELALHLEDEDEETQSAALADEPEEDEVEDEPYEDLLSQAKRAAAERSSQKEQSNYQSLLEQAKQEMQEFKDSLLKDPIGRLKELGYDPLDLANEAFERELGDDAPEDLKKKFSENNLERKIEARLEEFEKRQKEREAQEVQRQIEASANQLDQEIVAQLQDVPEQYGTLAKAAKRDVQAAYQTVIDGIVEYANITEKLPTAQQALQIAEESLSRFARLISDEQETTPREEAPVEEGTRRQRNRPTLSDADTSERPNRRTDDEDPFDTEVAVKRAMRILDQRRRSGQ